MITIPTRLQIKDCLSDNEIVFPFDENNDIINAIEKLRDDKIIDFSVDSIGDDGGCYYIQATYYSPKLRYTIIIDHDADLCPDSNDAEVSAEMFADAVIELCQTAKAIEAKIMIV
jgi:hypothetical protein